MIRAISDKIIVKPLPPDEISEGGIIVPDSVRQRPNKATVVSAGPGLPNKPMVVEEGDIVFHVKGCGAEIDYNGELLFVLDTSMILATYKPS